MTTSRRTWSLAWLACLMVTLLCEARAQSPVQDYWAGTASVGAEQTRIALTITREGDQMSAQLSLLDIGVMGWPVETITQEGSAIRAAFRSDRGLNVLSGQISGERLRGRWAMAGGTDTAQVVLALVTPPPTPRMEEITFNSGDVILSGTLVIPSGAGPWPGVVFVHGAGAETRDASRFLASYYAERGIASLIYDKRGAGQSGGDWQAVGFDALAQDVLAAVEVLKRRSEIDPAAIGLRGQSQGGWVAPLAASQSTEIAFVVTVAGPLVPPAEEGHWDAVRALQLAGYDTTVIAEVDALLAERDEAVRTGNWEPYRAALTKAQQRPWFDASGVSPEVNPDSWLWPWYRKILDFDPVPVFESLSIPLLALLGAEDESIPAQKSASILRRLRDDGHRPYTIVVYASVNHAMRKVPTGPEFQWPAYADGFLDRQVEWILEAQSRRK